VRLSELDGALQARAAAAAAAPSQLARGELVFWTTAGGAYIATNLCIDRCYTDRDAATVFTLTMGGALAISALASSHFHQGQAQLYNSAQVWGAWNGLWVNNGFAHDQQEGYVAVGAQLAGLAGGIGLWPLWHPTEGDVAFANSGLLWGALLGSWGQLAFGGHADIQTTVAISDVAMLAAAFATTQVKMSRGRTLLIESRRRARHADRRARRDLAARRSRRRHGVLVRHVDRPRARRDLDVEVGRGPAPAVTLVPMRTQDAWGLSLAFTKMKRALAIAPPAVGMTSWRATCLRCASCA